MKQDNNKTDQKVIRQTTDGKTKVTRGSDKETNFIWLYMEEEDEEDGVNLLQHKTCCKLVVN